MTLSAIPAALISEHWPELAALLAPAIAYDPEVSLEDVKAKLLSGQCEAAMVELDQMRGVIVTEICMLDGVKVCWISYVAGSVDGRPRRWLAAVRALASGIEELARAIGCEETRIGGRDWSRVLPGYARFDDVPNRLRKVL